MALPLGLVAAPFFGGLRGAISPPPGLSRTQGFSRGFARGIPGYKLGGTIAHVINGTTGQWADPANNPINNPQNFGGTANPYGSVVPQGMGPVQAGATPQGAGTFANDPTDPNNPNAFQNPYAAPAGGGGGGPTAGAWNNNNWNAWRSPGSQTWQQAVNPGSAIGPWGGGTVNPYNPNAPRTPTSAHVEGIPGWAAAAYGEIRKRNQP